MRDENKKTAVRCFIKYRDRGERSGSLEDGLEKERE